MQLQCTRLSAVVVGLSLGLVTVGCNDGSSPPGDETLTRTSAALTGPLLNDFEDGTTQGWFPFGSPTVANSTEVAFTGTHSLKTTGRTATFMGPGMSLTGQLSPGVTYRVSVAARLAAGEAPTTLRVTMLRTLADGTNQFDTVVASTNATADAWVTLAGNYSFSTAGVTGLILSRSVIEVPVRDQSSVFSR